MADKSSPHQQFVSILMNRVQETAYPSSRDLDRLEQSMTTREEYEDYVGYLMQLADQPRPSQEYLDRLQRLLAAIPAQSS